MSWWHKEATGRDWVAQLLQIVEAILEFEIRLKFEVLCFKMYATDHNEISHTSRQNFVVIGSASSKLEHSKFQWNWKKYLVMVGGGAGPISWLLTMWLHANCSCVSDVSCKIGSTSLPWGVISTLYYFSVEEWNKCKSVCIFLYNHSACRGLKLSSLC